jgi:hypothetical protein
MSFIGNLGRLLPFPISDAGACSSLSAAGALFFEGILVYYADATLLSEPYKSFTANLAVTKVRTPGWSVSLPARFIVPEHSCVDDHRHQIFLRAITCNWLVCLSIQLAALGKDLFSKILIIYIVIACFITEQFEHVVANFFIVQMGMVRIAPSLSHSCSSLTPHTTDAWRSVRSRLLYLEVRDPRHARQPRRRRALRRLSDLVLVSRWPLALALWWAEDRAGHVRGRAVGRGRHEGPRPRGRIIRPWRPGWIPYKWPYVGQRRVRSPIGSRHAEHDGWPYAARVCQTPSAARREQRHASGQRTKHRLKDCLSGRRMAFVSQYHRNMILVYNLLYYYQLLNI